MARSYAPNSMSIPESQTLRFIRTKISDTDWSMFALSLFLIPAWQRSSFAMLQREKQVYSSVPKLQSVFDGYFDKDSRSDYAFVENIPKAHWGDGFVKLNPGSTMKRQFAGFSTTPRLCNGWNKTVGIRSRSVRIRSFRKTTSRPDLFGLIPVTGPPSSFRKTGVEAHRNSRSDE